jgi:hypothetical protein
LVYDLGRSQMAKLFLIVKVWIGDVTDKSFSGWGNVDPRLKIGKEERSVSEV